MISSSLLEQMDMTMAIPSSLTEALRLTRAGKLGAATQAIQTMFANGAPSEAPAAADVLDLVPQRVAFAPPRQPGPTTAAKPGAGGTFADRSYAGPAGRLSYKLYVPAGDRRDLPLVVMLHGCTQSPDDFARGTGMNALADELGFAVVYPAQTQAANASRCWNWFKPGDQQRDRGEPALIAGITRAVIAELPIDPQRVYVAGLSAGGAAAAVMASAYPDLYAAAGIHSGLDCGAARDLPSAMMAMKQGGRASGSRPGGFVPIITFHGDRDATVHETNSGEIVGRAAALAGVALMTRSEQGRSDGGKAYTRTVSADAAGRAMIERWTIHGGGHAWSGGRAGGSYTDPSGPDASRAMLRFFLAQRLDAGSAAR